MDFGAVVGDGAQMLDSRRSTVTGLVPRAVRIEFDRGQVQLLTNELATRIETKGAALRETGERHGSIPHAVLSDATAWLFEYRALLEALNVAGEPRAPSSGVVVTASMAAADKLVRACTARAVELLREHIADRCDLDALRGAGAAAAAWVRTLADLRDLDENAPDTILE